MRTEVRANVAALTALGSLAALVAFSSCSTPRTAPAAATPSGALLDDAGEYHRAITTRSRDTQRLFDQGLLLCYGFDHEEATRLFQRAAELDPSCAIAHWGSALAAGPNINNPAMDEARSRAAFGSLAQARALAANASPIERALIEALSQRYAWPPPADRRALDAAYAAAMRDVARAHPTDDDVQTLFAESLMDLRPWDLWTKEGQPQPETPEIVATLEAVLARTPDHPGATHYLIHSLEASPHPERALPAADRLRHRVPGASHLVHMPAHIDIRVGHYQEAIEANRRATRVDQQRVARVGRGGFYAMYRAHHYHFLMWAAMFDGQSEVALRAARDVVRELPLEVVRGMPEFVEGFHSSPYHVLVRFGRWEEVLAEPEPAADLHGTTAARHYARALALSALGRIDEAERERGALEAACARVPETYLMGNNAMRTILDVARPMVEGELEYRRGNHERAFALLREAVARDDALRYDEPWGWVQPARHALGALLLEQGRVADAEAVYRTDLELHPHNGWSLHGLAECLRRRGEGGEAAEVEARFRAAWQRADVALRASCFCRRG